MSGLDKYLERALDYFDRALYLYFVYRGLGLNMVDTLLKDGFFYNNQQLLFDGQPSRRNIRGVLELKLSSLCVSSHGYEFPTR